MTPTKRDFHKSQAPQKRNSLTGYGLHASRLAFSREPAIRSIKFPLVPDEGHEKHLDDFASAVKSDYIRSVGDANFIDWYEREKTGQHTYSILDFWLDSLRAGVIFFEKPDAAQDYLQSRSGFDQHKAFLAYFERDKRFEKLNLEAVYQHCYFTTGMREQRNRSLFDSKYRQIVKPEYREGRQRELVVFLQEIIVKNRTGVSREERDNFWEKKKWFTSQPSPYEGIFIIAPEIAFCPDASAQDLIKSALDFCQEDKDLLKDRWGVSGQKNAFDRYFREALPVFQSDPDAVVKEMLIACPAWQGREKDLAERVGFLSRQAKRLEVPNLTTSLVKDWGQYRSFFGGKIESWVSNYMRQSRYILVGEPKKEQGQRQRNQRTEGKGQAQRHQEDIERALKKDFLNRTTLQERLKELQEVLRQACDIEAGTINNARLGVYRLELADVRTMLNRAYQKQYPHAGESGEDPKDHERANTDLKNLFEDIRQIPEFIGDAKRERFRAFVEAPRVLGACIKKLMAFERARKSWNTRTFSSASNPDIGSYGDVDYAKMILERLRKRYVADGFASGRFKKHVVAHFFHKHGLEEILSQPLGKERPVYRHPQARSKIEPLALEGFDLSKAKIVITSFADDCAPRWESVDNATEFMDAVWLEKIRVGVALDLAQKDSFSGEDLGGTDGLPDLTEFVRSIGTASFDKDQFSRMLQNYVLTVASGTLNQLSRSEYVERYSVQPMNTEKHYPLVYADRGNGLRTWGIVLGELTKKGDDKGKVFGKENGTEKDFGEEKGYEARRLEQDACLVPLRTSAYQMQFLEKAFGKSSWYKKHGLLSSLASYSFIVEEKINVRWDVKRGCVLPERTGESRIFVSIPFRISSEAKRDSGMYDRRHRVMGIDVGEYGVAYVILDYDRKTWSVKMVDKGFISEPLTHRIRDFIATWKNNQLKGTFAMPSTKLGRIRENAIGSLRNKIHAIALREEAMPVYEFQISAFETGSGKVSKIYNSVKAADVGAENEAEKAQQKLVWGGSGRGKWFGREVGAYATSYICMACGDSPHLERYTKEEERKDLRKKARPSLEAFLHSPESVGIGKKQIERFVEKRGNSAIYVCPACKHRSDADVQAAYWIGLKRILREKKYPKGDSAKTSEAKKQISVEELVAFHEKDVDPIELSLPPLSV